MKIKLKRLHPKGLHAQGCYNNYVHDSSKSEYGYEDYRIKTHSFYKDWNVYDSNDVQLNPMSPCGMSFREARDWLEDYINKRLDK
tara:strand:- start:323 stop:577 length:255 start_codon:yes stop_codon:yes gene_type:complete